MAEISARRIIQSEYERNPERSLLAIGSSESCRRSGEAVSAIGAWSEALGRFVWVAALCLGGGWESLPCELLINGVAPAIDWTPVPPSEFGVGVPHAS